MVSFTGSAFQSNSYEIKLGSLLLTSSSHARSSSGRQAESFGDDPGTDAAGLVTLPRESLWYPDQVSHFDVSLYDVEPSWKKYPGTLSSHFDAHVTLACKPCHVTQGMLLNVEDDPAESETDDVIQLSTHEGVITDDYTKYRRKM